VSPELARLAADPGLPPDAFRLLAYVLSLGEGEHEIESSTLRGLLRCKGDKPIYNARKDAERYGLTWRQGGRSHANIYGYLSPWGEVITNTSPPGEDQACPTTTTTTTTDTPPIPLIPSGLDRVQEYLGAEVVEAAGGSVLTPLKLVGLVGMYGPNGTQADRVFRGKPPDERRRALATAVLRYAMDADKYSNRLFERYLERAKDGESNDTTDTARRAAGGGRRTRPAGGASPETGGSDRRRPGYFPEE